MRRAIVILGIVLVALLGIAVVAPRLGLLGDPFHVTPATTAHPSVAIVYFSGDMGLHFGMGTRVIPALVKTGFPVLGVNSATLFGTHRDRAEVVAIVADALRQGLAKTGAHRVVLMGQSFGADMIATAAPDLPSELRAKIAAIVLVVPGQTVYFHADPLGFSYRGTPDWLPATALNRLDWAPLICIRGAAESDSLCPYLHGRNLRETTLPGGHFLQRNDKRLAATLTAELRRVLVR